MNTHLHLIIRFILLATGFACMTYGVLGWHELGFDPIFRARDTSAAAHDHIHPVYILILGLALIPPSLWEIFVFQARIDEDKPPNRDTDQPPRA